MTFRVFQTCYNGVAELHARPRASRGGPQSVYSIP